MFRACRSGPSNGQPPVASRRHLTRWLNTLTNPNPAYAYVDITPDSTYKCQVAREKDRTPTRPNNGQ